MRITLMAGFASVLFALPVGAQQPTPQTPATPATPGAAAPRGPGGGPMGGPGGPGMMGRQGPAGMGMAGGPGMRADDDDDDDDDDRPGRHWRWHHGRAHGAPTQIIINIGPNNQVEFETGGPRGFRRPGAGPMMGGGWGGPRMAEYVEARLGDLRNDLQLRPDQQPAWDRFAGAVREAAGRMTRPGPGAMAQGQTLEQRLAAHEAALTARLEAARSVRTALSGLTGALDESQRRTLEERGDRLTPGMGRMGARWRRD